MLVLVRSRGIYHRARRWCNRQRTAVPIWFSAFQSSPRLRKSPNWVSNLARFGATDPPRPEQTGTIHGMATTEDKRELGGDDQWKRELYETAPERQGELFSTISGLENEPLYTPERVALDYDRDLGYPGAYPFTRGVYPSMYRGRLWTMRQFAGFGTAEETNQRFRYLLDHGQTGLSTAFDMPTLMGYDSDHARSLGEVGREGVAIDTLDDMETLFAGIDLGEV